MLFKFIFLYLFIYAQAGKNKRKELRRDFPGDSLVKNPPFNAG